MSAAGVVRVGVFGAGGRMGRQIAAVVGEHPGLVLAVEVGRGAEGRGTEAEGKAFAGCDVVIDVSVAAATVDLVARLGSIPLVTGVTGRDAAQMGLIEAQAQRAAVLVAANFSLGVAVLARLARQAAVALQGFDAEVFELHHRHKVDAPSGTALHLAQAVAEARGLAWPEARAVRDGAGARGEGEVGVAALRGGGVAGEHTVYFCGPGERVELVHRAADRSVFAHGALRAARWLARRGPGLYDVEGMLADVMG